MENKLLTMSEAAKSVGNGVHLATVFRWTTRGIRGIKLEAKLIGGRRYVERAALAEFLARINGEPAQAAEPHDDEAHADVDAQLQRELATT